MSRPNVLLLMGDEHPVFMTAGYGRGRVVSPALDELASRSVVFESAYCPSPICAPSRAAMMAGRHVSAIEVWDNAAPFRSDWPTFAHSFRHAGYRTVLCGKMHFVGPDQRHGFEERWTQDVYPATFDWTHANRHGIEVSGGQSIRRVYEAGPGRTRDMDYDDEVAFRATYGLRQLARGADRRPWLLCCSFTSPHYPYKAPEAYWNRYADDDIDLPVIPPDYRQREHAYVGWVRQFNSFDHLVPDAVCRAARRATLGRITMLDDYLGRLLAVLAELGMADDTIVLYTTDHGDMMGEHGLWFKNVAYEWSSRVGLLIAGPGLSPRRVSEVVSLLDLGPTLCGLTGVEPVYEMTDGRDVSDLVLGRRAPGEGLAVIENYGDGIRRGVRTIVRGRHKLTVVPGLGSELFDLEADPGEWTNLADEPAQATLRDDLERQALAGWDWERLDETRWQSEERRLAILKALAAGPALGWQEPSPPPEHPLGFR